MKEVKASARLKSHPVCLTAGEGLSFEMEKYFQAVQPDASIVTFSAGVIFVCAIAMAAGILS